MFPVPLGNRALIQLWLSDTEEVLKFYDKAEEVKIKQFNFIQKKTVRFLICLFQSENKIVFDWGELQSS